jgi:hypothetical protein
VIAVRRARHLAIWLAFAAALPVLLYFALRARPAAPTQPELPAAVDRFPDDAREASPP